MLLRPSALPEVRFRAHFVDHLSSIFRRMRSAAAIAFAMVHSDAGVGVPFQSMGSFLAAKMLAAISRTRLRPSSMRKA